MTELQHITIYTDGACKGNPGPGGWGALLSMDGSEKEIFGGEGVSDMTVMLLNVKNDTMVTPCCSL